MSYKHIEFSINKGVAILILNRPDKLNSFNQLMHKEIREVLKKVNIEDNIRCLLITANGRGFCAGQDLDERKFDPDAAPIDLGESIEKNYNPMIRLIRSLKLPVICAVNGVAAGAGANLALSCDIVLASTEASFIQAFSRIGLVPDSGGTWTLPHAVGIPRAMALSLLGEKITAEQAERWGMIWKTYPPNELYDKALKMAIDLSVQPTSGLALIKKAIQCSPHNTLDQQLDLERDLQRLAGQSDDYKEGVTAFIEKRRPNFTGK
ncbi:2-(1,2-epoxy-1,2-dihydrophenyl)acetyl-CoA isomerase PaaG [Colwellia sp. PAMC 21821]|uniref:2-(1,2-epoxy-1,2-dihydrophenyl)acetyl-CoA isomerase PaaG n=1 Tax=Colwellia sp. PAMC 21821 TaxID=1816219 RepID=UPI0009C04DA8|nr:2-(1,2-epoxy-1,2-dihydrophenyl)acetyl-CoA isomerase PaaG [Colwellia sp. PAMC 21821]ARD43538.1 2-(1,2-epoxy-1,2-dihydrophenyl)acetyl-CoA isomerase [Colwellia sp. PAMC 21821]